MVLVEWQHVVVKWVNCLDLRNITINHVGELPLDTFFQEISIHLKRTTEGKIYDSITAFLHNEFPDFDFNHKALVARKCNDTESTYILSILIFHCFIKDDNSNMRDIMCQRLDPSCQEVLRDFISHLYDKTITRNNIKAAINRIKTNYTESPSNHPRRSHRLCDTPKSRSPLNAALTTPMFQQQKLLEERSRELKKIKLELECEVSEKIDLKELLQTEKEKTKNLNAKLAEKRNIITKLQEDLLSSQNEMSCPDEGKTNVERSLREEIKSMQTYILDLQNEIDPVREELDTIKRQLAKAEQCSNMWQQQVKDTDLQLEKVSLELYVKTNELGALHELCKEQENHIRGMTRNEFNCSIESDEALERLFSPQKTVECVPLSLTVVDIQLKEKEAENMELNQHIDLLSLSKCAVEKELADVQSVLHLRDSDISTHRNEIKLLMANCSALQDKLADVERMLSVKTDLIGTLEIEVSKTHQKLEESAKQAKICEDKNTKLETSIQMITLCIQNKLAHLEAILASFNPSTIISHEEWPVLNFNSKTGMSEGDMTNALDMLIDRIEMESKHSVQECCTLTETCNELNRKLLDYQDSTASLEAKERALSLEKDTLAERLSLAEESRFHCGQRIEQLSKEIEDQASLVSILEQNIVNLESSRGKLEEEFAASVEQLQTTLSDLEDARLDKDNLLEFHNQMKKDSEEERCSLIAHANELQTKLAYEAEAMVSFQGNFEETKQQYAIALNDLDQLSRDYSLLKEERTSLQGILLLRDSELAQSQSQMEALVSNNASVQQRLSVAETELNTKTELLVDLELTSDRIHKLLAVALVEKSDGLKYALKEKSLRFNLISEMDQTFALKNEKNASNLCRKLYNLEKQIQILVNERDYLSDLLTVLNKDLLEVQAAKESLLEMHNDVTKTNKNHIESLNCDISNLKTTIMKLEHENELAYELQQSLEGKISELSESKETLAQTYAQASSLSKEQIAELTNQVSELEHDLSLLKTAKEEINANLKLSQSELLQAKQCNETLCKEMKFAIEENEQRTILAQSEFEQRLKTCEVERDVAIKTLTEEFTKISQEKDSVIQQATETANVLQQEIDGLTLQTRDLSGELQNIKCEITEMTHRFEDAVEEKSSLLKRVEELDTELKTETMMRTTLELKLTQEKSTLESKISELSESKETLAQTYAQASSLSKEQIAELTSQVSELEHDLSLLKTAKEEMNANLKRSQSELLQAKQCNETLGKEIKFAIEENDQRTILAQSEFEQRLRSCKVERDEAIKTLAEEFTKISQEKDSVIQQATETANVLQREIDGLTLQTMDLSAELQNIKCEITEMTHRFEDAVEEKSSLLKHVEELETELRTETMMCTTLELKLTQEKSTLESKISELSESKETLAQTYAQASSLSKEQIAELTSQVSELEHDLSLLKTAKEEINANLKVSQSELLQAKQCNETLGKEIKFTIEENKQRTIRAQSEFEQRLRTGEVERDEAIKTLTEEFTKISHEKDCVIQQATDIANVRQQEIDVLTLQTRDLSGELQNIKCEITEMTHRFEDAVEDKSSLLKRVEELETELKTETMMRTTLELKLTQEKSTLEATVLQFATLQQSLESKISELSESKETLAQTYAQASSLSKEQIAELTSQVSELEHDLSLLKTAKEEINANLKLSQSELLQAKQCNENLGKEMKFAIEENEQRTILAQSEFEQRLRTCTVERCEAIKTLTEEFTKISQEKDSVIQQATQTANVLQQEIDGLTLQTRDLSGELQNIKCELTEMTHRFEDAVEEKSSLLKHVEELETELRTETMMRTTLELKLTQEKSTLEATVLQSATLQQSLESKISELSESKETLAQTYALASSLSKEQIAELTGQVSELNHDVSMLKTEKEDTNANLILSQTELLKVKQCNKTLTNEMKLTVMDNEQRIMHTKSELELRLKKCEKERDATIKLLQEELVGIRENITVLTENFTREIQEKDVVLQAAIDTGDVLRHEMNQLTSENEKINDELQNVQFVLAETMNTLDDTLAEKTALLKRAEEAEVERNAETDNRAGLELQLADIRANLEQEVLRANTAIFENKVLSDLLVKSRDLVNELRELISCEPEKIVPRDDEALIKKSEGSSTVLPITKQYSVGSEVDNCLSQSLPESLLPEVSIEPKLCLSQDIESNISPTPVFQELISILHSIKLDVIQIFKAKMSLEDEMSSFKLHWETLCEESNTQLQSSMCQISRLQGLLQESEDKEKNVLSELYDLKKCNEVLGEKLGEQEKLNDRLGRDVDASILVRCELSFQVAALKERNEKLRSSVEDKLTYYISRERRNWELLNIKNDIDLKYRNILSSRRQLEQTFYDLCNHIQQMKGMYSMDCNEELTQVELDADNILDNIEDQNTEIHAELLNALFEYIKWSEFNAEPFSVGAEDGGEPSFVKALQELSKGNPIPELQSRIQVLQATVNSTRTTLESTCPKVSDVFVDLEDSLEVQPTAVLVSKTCLLREKVKRLEAIQNHSNQLYHNLQNTNDISSSLIAIGKCSQSALQSRLTNLKSENKRLSDEKNAAFELISSLKLKLTQQNKEEACLREAYLKLLDESDQVRGDLAKTSSLLVAQEREKQHLEEELKSTSANLQEKCDLMGKQYEEKLQRMKQKMTTLFKEEIAKIEPVKIENERLELLCKKHIERIKKYEEYTQKTNFEMKRMKDELQNEVMDKKLLQQQVSTLNCGLEARSLMETSAQHEDRQVENNGRYRDQGGQAVTQTRVQRTMNMVDEKEDCIVYTCRKSVVRKSFTQGLRQAFTEEDEDGEEFNNTYLADMKAGRIRLPEPDKRRLTELQYRNSMCLPHLKSSYPAETQFNDPREFREDDLKLGFGIDDGDSSSLSLLLPGERHRKKDRGQTSYQKPGPPTPVKNGGRRSLQAAEAISPRPALRDHNETVGSRTKASTPSRIRALFSTKNTSKRDAENTPVTPRGRRLSIFRK